MRFLCLFIAGCGTVHVESPAGLQPKLVSIQLYAATAHDAKRDREVRHYAKSLEIEAGCMKAARDAGQPISVFRSRISVDTPTTVTFLDDSIDPPKVAHETGADLVIDGRARLTPRSERVEKVRLEARDRGGQLMARADYSNSDGAEPFDAGESVCKELFQRWGVRAVPAATLPTSVYLFGSRAEALNEGCQSGLLSAGVQLIPQVPLLNGPGSRWDRLTQQTGANGFVVTDFSYPIDNQRHILIAVAWLLDAHGVVLDSRVFRANMVPGKPEVVGRELCQSLFKR